MLKQGRGFHGGRSLGRAERQRGFTLMEVLVTIIILVFGLLGLAAMQATMVNTDAEGYSRAQAVAILGDMTARLEANAANGASYITTTPLGTPPSGTPGTVTSNCPGLATRAAIDLCEWGNALLGAAESNGSNSVGAMVGARGCISQVQTADATTGICRPAIYDVVVVWQGRTATVAPSNTCGQYLYDVTGSNSDTHRRLVSAQVVVPLNAC